MARKDAVSLEDKKIVVPMHERACDYCGAKSHGSVNGRAYCDEHFFQALDGVRPMQQVKARA